MLTSVALHFLIQELQFLAGSRIEKIYHPKKEELLLSFHVKDQGKVMLRAIAGKALFLTIFKEDQSAPSGFCMFLRKYLDNARCIEISQISSERIARFVFEKEKKYALYVEFFGRGNIIATDEQNIILNALEQKKWADREIMKGKEYRYPKKSLNIFELEHIAPDKELVIYLAKDLGLGGRYAEEICARTDIPKRKKELSEEEKQSIVREIKNLVSQKPDPGIVAGEVVPFDLITMKGEKQGFTSLNKAYDQFFEQTKVFVSRHQQNIEKTQRIIEDQEMQVKELEQKAEEERMKAELNT